MKKKTKKTDTPQFRILSPTELHIIEKLIQMDVPVADIALQLGKNLSSIYDAIKRGLPPGISGAKNRKKYRAEIAIARRERIVKKLNSKKPDFFTRNKRAAKRLEFLMVEKKMSPAVALKRLESETGKKYICLRTLYNYLEKGYFTRLENDIIYKKKEEAKVIKAITGK